MDFLRCNRCGKCREVCPVAGSEIVEWASARGKFEIAEAFFRGEKLSEKSVRSIFDLCLHCKTCEENCPSGARGDRVVSEVLAEMGRRGVIPLMKKIALKVLDRADSFIFRVIRFAGGGGKAQPHRGRGKSPLRFMYPLLGWPVQRLLPLPAKKPFIRKGPDIFEAAGVEQMLRNLNPDIGSDDFDSEAAAGLIEKIRAAREDNLKNGRKALFFVGDAVNQFFGDEAEDIVLVLNFLGIDVQVPQDQTCCFAPALYAGDTMRAAEGARRLVKILSRYDFDWLVTSCASGGLMLREEYPRLLGLTDDSYGGVVYDSESELVRINERQNERTEEGNLYLDSIAERVRDINELVGDLLGYRPGRPGYHFLFSGGKEKEIAGAGQRRPDGVPAVVYHQPCHLNRGQKISGEPVYILKLLPGVRFIKMANADICCGGGGLFTFTEPEISARVGREKARWIAEADPDMVATSCPLCRIQIADMLQRDYGKDMPPNMDRICLIPVLTPIQLLARDLRRMSGEKSEHRANLP
ncbi:MAG: 4Fe-4S dicluster domain-containing protein [Candidatus Latescibacteria bacterium]|nr:4Fe-4S dicluster domain-containing protein [bacterium]MBD3424447.1 4Fe-4S dicluster domain-containing protein [Candidatus Latescibacterota bacterium]